ncbi:MAG: hypothetical protein HY744_30335 [Deltaproteobacteria bacterium]|nr:hypothetical protein [Deltaproteobacteria bacterium]
MLDAQGLKAARERFRHQLPYPIAINYKRIGACPEPNATRLMYVLKTAEMSVRLLGIVALADLRRIFGKSRVPDGAFGGELGGRFGSPSFGTWLWILRESLKLLRSSGAEPFVPELRDFHFTGKDKSTDNVKALDELCVIRNRFAHDQVGPEEWLVPRQIPAMCERALPALEGVLQALLFLADYPIVLVSPILVEKKRGAAPRYVRNKILIAGCSDQFDVERDSVEHLCESAEVLLLHRDGQAYLNLDPLMVHSSEGVEERESTGGGKVHIRTDIPDIFLYNGGRAGSRRYLACNKGGELNSRDCSAADYIEGAFAELLGMLGAEQGPP